MNVVLNRLVREGVIAGFKTNFDGPSAALGLHVIVTADGIGDGAGRAHDPKRAEDVRRLVSRELDRLVDDATVTVETAD